MKQGIGLWAAILTLVCVISQQLNADIISNFDDGTLQGWVNLATTDFSVINPGVGGNPGGFLAASDLIGGANDPAILRAPIDYTGDLTQYAEVSFDALALDGADPAFVNAVIIESSNGTFWAFRPTFSNLFNAWSSYSVPINGGTGWFLSGLNNGPGPFDSFADTVSNVANFYMTIGGNPTITEGFENGLDNISLVVPEPSGVSLLVVCGTLALRRRRRIA